MRRLMILEVSQKQAYIFASRRLRENAARSEDIRYVTESRFFQRAAGPLYREEEDLVYAGGGHTVLQFDSRERADAFARAVTETAMVQFPGLELFVKQLDYDENKTPGENLKALSAALEGKKALRRASFRRPTFGVEQAQGETVPPGRVAGGIEVPEHWCFPAQFEELAGADNFIAVVHADGNGMGRRVERIYESCTHWEDCRRALQDFSQGIQADFETAFRQTVETVIASGYAPDRLPIRPVVLAGDDVCFVTAGSIGLECARVFLQKLSALENCRQPGQPYAACAGVAMVHKKYPFHRAYDLAEELCASAKRFGAEIDDQGRVSAMDWHIEFGQLKDGLATQREDYETEDGCRMELRPVVVLAPEGVDRAKLAEKTGGVRTYAFFQAMHRLLRGEYGQTARAKLKGLRTAVKQGKTAAAFYLGSRELSDLLYHSFAARYQTEEERKRVYPAALESGNGLEMGLFQKLDGVDRCLFFDGVELIDHGVDLEEVQA